MNTFLSASTRLAPVAAASLVLAVLAATPANALVASGTPFNGFFTTTVATSGITATGAGTSANSPMGITTENFSYTLTSFSTDANGNYPVSGTVQFTTTAPGSTVPDVLYANVIGAINISNYTGTGTDTFNPLLSTGMFAGATGTATFNATVINQAAKTINDQYSGSFNLPAAVPEASSTVSLGLLLALGLGGVAITARRKRAQ